MAPATSLLKRVIFAICLVERNTINAHKLALLKMAHHILFITLFLSSCSLTPNQKETGVEADGKTITGKQGMQTAQTAKQSGAPNQAHSRQGVRLRLDTTAWHTLRLGHTVNSGQSEYYPCPHPDGSLLFSAMDRTGHFEYRVDFTQTRHMGGEDVFRAATGHGIYEDARPWLDMNSNAHEVVTQVIDRQRALLTANYSENMGPDNQDAARSTPDLFMLRSKGAKTQLEHFPEPVNSIYGEYDGWLVDDNTLLFVSDRPGGVGGYHKKGWRWNGNLWGNTDVYVTLYKDGQWMPPIHLGETVNTPYAERTPSLSPDGRTLYIASNGFADSALNQELVYFTRSDTRNWTQWVGPFWMKALSSPGDDWGLRFDGLGQLYFTRSLPLPYKTTQSARDGDAGAMETNFRSGYKVKGGPSAALCAGAQSDIFWAVPLSRSVVASIQGLFFDTDSHEPQPAALPDIVRMADMILLNPNHRYRLIGYADVRGGAAHNQRLSLRRAERVRELLLQNGVPATQITAVGRGAITTAKQNSSTTLQQNRRVDLESIL